MKNNLNKAAVLKQFVDSYHELFPEDQMIFIVLDDAERAFITAATLTDDGLIAALNALVQQKMKDL